MEIVHIVLGKANPERMNGVNKVVNSLATYQTKLGHDVSIWGITSNFEKNFPPRNYKTELYPIARYQFFVAKSLIERIKNMDQEVAFHIHGGFIPIFYSIARLLVKYKYRYLFTPHGAYNQIAMQRNYWGKKWYYFFFDQVVVKHAEAIHCIGDSEIMATEKLTKHPSCQLIPNGQNPTDLKFNKTPIEKPTVPVFGTCGRIDIHTKGLDLLLVAFKEFIAQNDNQGALWIIGDGTELHILQEQAEDLGIVDNIVFWGKRFGEEKLNIMSNMDAFFQPSRNEGLPGSVLEAAALQVPCVVSKESNMADYVNEYEAGIGMEQNDIAHITAAMMSMALAKSNGTIQQQRENAFKMIVDSFNWEKIAEKLVVLYGANNSALG